MNKLQYAGQLSWLTFAGLLFFIVALTGCNMPQNAIVGSTLSPSRVFETVNARLTDVVAPVEFTTGPSPTPNSPATPSVTVVPTTAVLPASATEKTPTLGASCDQAAAGIPIDVTIPDDTRMQPGQVFTKIWRLRNTGSCTWSEEYQVFRFSGEAMAAPDSVPLSEAVAPGQSVEIAIDMVAPKEAGTFQSNWKLRNARGNVFGIGPNGQAPFWVRIVVLATPTPSPSPGTPVVSVSPTHTVTSEMHTATATETTGTPQAIPAATPTPTETITPTVTLTSTVGTGYYLQLGPGDAVSLEDGANAEGDSEDLLYLRNPDGRHLLAPGEGFRVGIYGGQKPEQGDCRVMILDERPLVVEFIARGMYMCFYGEENREGWFRLAGFDHQNEALEVEFFIWTE